MKDNNSEGDKQKKNKEHSLLDQNVVDFAERAYHEDPLLTQLGSSDSSSEEYDGRVSEVSAWMSDKDDYRDETRISPQESTSMSIAREYKHFYPEMTDILQVIENMIEHKERYNVSINGYSRKQQVEVLSAMFAHGREQESEDEGSKKKGRLKTFGGD